MTADSSIFAGALCRRRRDLTYLVLLALLVFFLASFHGHSNRTKGYKDFFKAVHRFRNGLTEATAAVLGKRERERERVLGF